MRRLTLLLAHLLLCCTLFAQTPEHALERKFLAVPDPHQAEEHLRILTAAPHIAGSAEDKKTAEYVARKFREWGFETEIVEYKVWMNYPQEISVAAMGPDGVVMRGPTKEHVVGDAFQDDPRVVPAFNGYSPSGDVEAEAVYANYGRPEDFQKLKDLGIDVRGKVVIVRYGENFRGVKAYMAQATGAAGMLIYSDPVDDGYFRGEVYPHGPWRPDTSVQRGTIEFGFEHPGDPTTPGWASTAGARRIDPAVSPDMPTVPTTPLSSHDAAPILQSLGGPETPQDWRGALPFAYHIGPGPVRVKLHLKQDYGYRTIWNVIARIRGSRWPEELVIAGNHRDAWVYGAVDPGSGTVAMLEAARGIGRLLKSGWRPQRTIVFASWDAEEQGLIGSTEWLEDHEKELEHAAAYFNVDIGAVGPNFRAAAVPSLGNFMRDIARAVPSPSGGTLYDAWRDDSHEGILSANLPEVSNLGSGSDFTPFLDHSGVPSTDIRSTGSYGVYHSVFDDFAWYKKFGDPHFLYTQEMARFFGLQVLRMANARVLPYDYEAYGNQIASYLDLARLQATERLGDRAPKFDAAQFAARRFTQAAAAISNFQEHREGSSPSLRKDSGGRSPSSVAGVAAPPLSRLPLARQGGDIERLNKILLATERALLLPQGLPRRPWFRHAIYAPADLKGYAASVIPGVTEAIGHADAPATTEQLQSLTNALNRAAALLESYKDKSEEVRSQK
jgi:N-acetylated-alpha-linked acidic dipeptidase